MRLTRICQTSRLFDICRRKSFVQQSETKLWKSTQTGICEIIYTEFNVRSGKYSFDESRDDVIYFLEGMNK